ncbi:hypothetical protein M885DRAFT_510137 [Pelagophyceae sp. CCMP2097]|nr:hypothetical protein M885DRAFT_510137 [Pelagophyceae sp. CCMP2097]
MAPEFPGGVGAPPSPDDSRRAPARVALALLSVAARRASAKRRLFHVPETLVLARVGTRWVVHACRSGRGEAFFLNLVKDVVSKAPRLEQYDALRGCAVTADWRQDDGDGAAFVGAATLDVRGLQARLSELKDGEALFVQRRVPPRTVDDFHIACNWRRGEPLEAAYVTAPPLQIPERPGTEATPPATAPPAATTRAEESFAAPVPVGTPWLLDDLAAACQAIADKLARGTRSGDVVLSFEAVFKQSTHSELFLLWFVDARFVDARFGQSGSGEKFGAGIAFATEPQLSTEPGLDLLRRPATAKRTKGRPAWIPAAHRTPELKEPTGRDAHLATLAAIARAEADGVRLLEGYAAPPTVPRPSAPQQTTSRPLRGAAAPAEREAPARPSFDAQSFAARPFDTRFERLEKYFGKKITKAQDITDHAYSHVASLDGHRSATLRASPSRPASSRLRRPRPATAGQRPGTGTARPGTAGSARPGPAGARAKPFRDPPSRDPPPRDGLLQHRWTRLAAKFASLREQQRRAGAVASLHALHARLEAFKAADALERLEAFKAADALEAHESATRIQRCWRSVQAREPAAPAAAALPVPWSFVDSMMIVSTRSILEAAEVETRRVHDVREFFAPPWSLIDSQLTVGTPLQSPANTPRAASRIMRSPPTRGRVDPRLAKDD